MERDVRETIKRNKDALHQPYDDQSIDLFVAVNKCVSLKTISDHEGFGYILADGLIVGYEM